MIQVPPRLFEGDCVALLSASSPTDEGDECLIDGAVALLESWGLSVQVGANVRAKHLYFDGTDKERASSITSAYQNPDVKALFFTRGGYGASRLFGHLEDKRFAGIRKAVVGYSDVTSLLLFFQHVCDMVVFHGPNIATERMLESPDKKTSQDSLYDQLFHSQTPPISGLQIHNGGVAEVQIVGGNLTRLVGTIGTRYEIETDGRNLFIEDVGKGATQIDAMVTHLRNARKLVGVRGVVFADMAQCRDLEILWEGMKELFPESNIPVVSGLPSGHGKTCLTIPLGAEVILDADAGTISFPDRMRSNVA